jgi:hypothetical protein
MDKNSISDELRQIERYVVEGERLLAEKEAHIVELKRQGQDTTSAEREYEMMRQNQRRWDQDRQRLLSLLQP